VAVVGDLRPIFRNSGMMSSLEHSLENSSHGLQISPKDLAGHRFPETDKPAFEQLRQFHVRSYEKGKTPQNMSSIQDQATFGHAPAGQVQAHSTERYPLCFCRRPARQRSTAVKLSNVSIP
jgi:hypothetical protein